MTTCTLAVDRERIRVGRHAWSRYSPNTLHNTNLARHDAWFDGKMKLGDEARVIFGGLNGGEVWGNGALGVTARYNNFTYEGKLVDWRTVMDHIDTGFLEGAGGYWCVCVRVCALGTCSISSLVARRDAYAPTVPIWGTDRLGPHVALDSLSPPSLSLATLALVAQVSHVHEHHHGWNPLTHCALVSHSRPRCSSLAGT